MELHPQPAPRLSVSIIGRPLAPPSTSAEALAEVAQLEELWRLPAKRAITGMD
jgi:hypothetical protein